MSRAASLTILLAAVALSLAVCKSSPTSPEAPPVEPPAKPVIALSSATLALTCATGETEPVGGDLQIWNSGGETLDYAITDDAPWLEVTPDAGSSHGERKLHFVRASPGGLGPGTHAATLTVACGAASNSPQTVGVTLSVSEKPPRVEVSVESLSFTAKTGGGDPAAREFQVRNSGGGTLRYQVSSDAAWLTVFPPDGSSEGEPRTHTAGVSAAGLQPGRHTAALTVSIQGAANIVRIPVVFELISSAPRIRTSDVTLAFTGTVGGGDPPPQNLQVWNSGEGRLAYGIASDAAWLTVTPAEGTSDGEKRDHRIAVAAAGLEEGKHTAELTIADPKADNSPVRITVSLDLGAGIPQIQVSPASLNFAGTEGGTNPVAQTLQVWNGAAGTLTYAIASNATWLTVSPAQGTSTGARQDHQVAVNVSGLATGQHTGVLTVTDPRASNNPVQVQVVLTLGPGIPRIQVSPASLNFAGTEGGTNPAAQTLQVWNGAAGTLTYAIASNATWLTVSPTQGTSTGARQDHQVAVNVSGLAAGQHTGVLTVSDPRASNNPVQVQVVLTLGAGIPQIQVLPASLDFAGTEGGTNPAAQTLQVWNGAAGTLTYAIASNSAWLNVAPTEGTSTGTGERRNHEIAVNVSGLAAGQHTGMLTVTDPRASNNPVQVQVVLTLAAGVPQIAVSPANLDFAGTEGGTNPAAQTLQVWNGAAGTLNYQIASNSSWLTAAPTSGSSTGARQDHAVTVNISGLASGQHTGVLTISDLAASNNPVQVQVVLTLAAGVPQIAVSPANLDFAGTEGGANPAAQTLQVWNGAARTLNYQIASNSSWLTAAPTSGSSTGARQDHAVTVNISGLASGQHTGVLTVSDPAASNNPVQVQVVLTLGAGIPQIAVSPVGWNMG